jgi:hypothetical protein
MDFHRRFTVLTFEGQQPGGRRRKGGGRLHGAGGALAEGCGALFEHDSAERAIGLDPHPNCDLPA